LQAAGCDAAAGTGTSSRMITGCVEHGGSQAYA
jgi:hypothetical protein